MYKGDTSRTDVVDSSNESLYHPSEETPSLVRNFSLLHTILNNFDVFDNHVATLLTGSPPMPTRPIPTHSRTYSHISPTTASTRTPQRTPRTTTASPVRYKNDSVEKI